MNDLACERRTVLPNRRDLADNGGLGPCYEHQQGDDEGLQKDGAEQRAEPAREHAVRRGKGEHPDKERADPDEEHNRHVGEQPGAERHRNDGAGHDPIQGHEKMEADVSPAREMRLDGAAGHVGAVPDVVEGGGADLDRSAVEATR